MTKIDIYSGFLGAGKTTLIKKLVKEAYAGMKIVIIENEFGEIGIDGGFLQDAGVEVREMNSGCICCSLTGDFKEALKMVLEQYEPDRVIIEPSGVGKLSEVAAAVMATGDERFVLGGLTTVVDASKCKMYMKNFGEFFVDQVGTAHCVILSRTGKLSAEKVQEAVGLIKEKNAEAKIITADWDELDGKVMLETIDGRDALTAQMEELLKEHEEHEHEHHHHHHDHDHDHEHEHHHHHHEDGEECSCGCGHHHDADEVFTSWGIETANRYTEEQINDILEDLNASSFGIVLRAKG
ncbi:MAG: GTP-binding protein, partial [Clostridia bacterium]|nr:GTP-binding protein [Clostridia bacterium]